MRAVIQRVTGGSVDVEGITVGAVGSGMVILLGVGKEDSEHDVDYLVEKIINLRIFEDDAGKMNLSLMDVQGEALVVSQFTLYGDCRKGRRPNFSEAASPEQGEELYNKFIKALQDRSVKVATGTFRAYMSVKILNDGPVTLILDSSKQL
ncbi:MAG: D-tyrosyl-tRNA(Tyr) deacylase [Firmicutes bacterium]|nr:D-tyrosyl-tRNA(Tyr) deacylase [Bacillota bacterium]